MPRSRPLPLLATIAVASSVLTAATATRAAASAPTAVPPLKVQVLVSGLAYPWDVSFTPDGTMIFDQRGGRLSVRTPAGTVRTLTANLSDLFVGSESGLEGLVVDPAFATNRRFYTCQAYKGSGSTPVDLRVIRWQVDTGYTAATRVGSPVVTGLPITSGRHGGCRLRFAPDGTLHVGTGDAAVGTNPQNLQSLGGKTLRVNADGTIPTDNPFYAQGGNARYVYTYGHRNVQGLALQPGTGRMWTVEHGTDRDDEINVEQAGGNYGWDPVPGYDESTPMTDLTKFPNAITARWSSGYPTIAPSGGTFLTGSSWGRWQGALAVGVLKGEGVMIVTVDPAGTVLRTERVPALQTGYGRIRAAQSGPDGALYLTTSNGSDDKILRVTPTATTPTYHPGQDVSPAGVAAALTTTGTLAVVARGTDGRAWVRLRTASSAGSWQALPGTAHVSAPAVVAGSGDRLDAFAHDTGGAVLHWVYDGTTWSAAPSLGGILTTAPAAAAPGDGTLDVVGRGRDNALWRRHYDGSAWGPWTHVGGRLTAAPGAAADPATGHLLVSVRGTNGHAYRAVLSATGVVSTFARSTARLWTAQALAPVTSGSDPWAVETSFDGSPVLSRGAFVDALVGRFAGAPAVTTAPGRGPVVVGRAPSGSVWTCDASAGHCSFTSLGGRTV